MTHLHDQILPEGTQIGVCEIKTASRISTFDITYRAWNHHLKGWVVVQEYFPRDFAIRANDGIGIEFKSPDDKENFEYGLQAFLDQAEILTQIEHLNISTAENALQINGTAYLIIDYQDGVPLSKLARSPGSFTETELKFILVSILNALQKVHQYKIVHGGIQPATILLNTEGEPLLIDFATARLAIAAHTAKLKDELVAGYAPAEQYESINESGPATDFYALGATMYYCITHNPPVAAQNRITALSKGEPDPMALLSELQGAAYSTELIEAINWMLQPEYNNRPQSAIEILTLLKSEHVYDQPGSATFPQEAINVVKHGSAANDRIGMSVMVGITALITVGLWLGESPSELLDDKHNTDKIIAQESDSGKLFEYIKEEANDSEKQPQQKDAERSTASADDHPSENGLIVEGPPFPENISTAKPELKDKIKTQPEFERNQQAAMSDKLLSQSKKQNLPEKSMDGSSIKEHLVAAEKAMKAEHFTTPLRDNAHKYYQRVLAAEPDNEEAFAGLQRIVDRYIQFIEKARTEGKLNTVKLYLQRAESVLPNDPKLLDIKAELAAVKE